MFCTKCGNNNPDGAPFCTSCGAPLNVTEAQAAGGSSMADKMPPQVNDFINKMKNADSNLYKMVGAGVAALVVLIIVISVIVSNTGINGTVNKFEKALKRGDMESLAEVAFPKSYINDVIIEDQYDGDKGEYKEDMKEAKENYKEAMKDSDSKIVYIKKTKVKKVDKDEKEELIEQIEEAYDIDVKDVREVKLKIKGKEDGDTEIDTQEFTFYKSGAKWYIYGASMFGMMF